MYYKKIKNVLRTKINFKSESIVLAKALQGDP